MREEKTLEDRVLAALRALCRQRQGPVTFEDLLARFPGPDLMAALGALKEQGRVAITSPAHGNTAYVTPE